MVYSDNSTKSFPETRETNHSHQGTLIFPSLLLGCNVCCCCIASLTHYYYSYSSSSWMDNQWTPWSMYPLECCLPPITPSDRSLKHLRKETNFSLSHILKQQLLSRLMIMPLTIRYKLLPLFSLSVCVHV